MNLGEREQTITKNRWCLVCITHGTFYLTSFYMASLDG